MILHSSNNSVGLETKGDDKRYRQESEVKQQSEKCIQYGDRITKVLAM